MTKPLPPIDAFVFDPECDSVVRERLYFKQFVGDDDTPVNPGDMALTPFAPRGLVRVLDVGYDGWLGHYAEVLFLHEHYGYPAGDVGIYLSSTLVRL